MTTKTNDLTKDQEKAMNEMNTVSAKIRFLDGLGWTRSQIAKKLDKRYQHVRNVLITPIKEKAKQ